MKNIRYSLISVILNVITGLIILGINYKEALTYLSSDGKTRSLFGITDILVFSYKYYLLIASIISILLFIISLKQKENRKFSVTSLLLSILSVFMICLPIWKVMIKFIN
jgi:hypothetical protein